MKFSCPYPVSLGPSTEQADRAEKNSEIRKTTLNQKDSEFNGQLLAFIMQRKAIGYDENSAAFPASLSEVI